MITIDVRRIKRSYHNGNEIRFQRIYTGSIPVGRIALWCNGNTSVFGTGVNSSTLFGAVLCWCSQVIMKACRAFDMRSNRIQGVILINHNLILDCGKRDKLSSGNPSRRNEI